MCLLDEMRRLMRGQMRPTRACEKYTHNKEPNSTVQHCAKLDNHPYKARPYQNNLVERRKIDRVACKSKKRSLGEIRTNVCTQKRTHMVTPQSKNDYHADFRAAIQEQQKVTDAGASAPSDITKPNWHQMKFDSSGHVTRKARFSKSVEVGHAGQ